jgi:uncharacterized protein (DUF305 family)
MDPWRHLVRSSALAAAVALPSTSFAPARNADLHAPAAGSNTSSEAPYLAQNDTAMKKMMAGMAVKPTGDVDSDFVAMMVPHHQGAIDMAIAVLRYGRNETIRRLAQEIIVTQHEEIAAMRLAVGEPLPPSAPSPTQSSSQRGLGMPANMNMK